MAVLEPPGQMQRHVFVRFEVRDGALAELVFGDLALRQVDDQPHASRERLGLVPDVGKHHGEVGVERLQLTNVGGDDKAGLADLGQQFGGLGGVGLELLQFFGRHSAQ